MISTIDMQNMRHLNLFGEVTQIRTRLYFKYNEILFFCVPKQLVSKAVGEGGRNVKRLSEILRKRIKIIPIPKGIEHLHHFISAIVSPVTFKDLKVEGDEIILTAGSQSKAALIGRNKRRFLEMQGILSDFFGKGFRIV